MPILGSYYLQGLNVNGVRLFAPAIYWQLSENEKFARGYDCGPGKMGAHFVPNTLWGLNIREACRIHDCMYALGLDKNDKWLSDVVFLTNMNTFIESGAKILRGIRRYRAMSYFSMVRDFGGSSFWPNKKKPDTAS